MEGIIARKSPLYHYNTFKATCEKTNTGKGMLNSTLPSCGQLECFCMIYPNVTSLEFVSLGEER